MSRKGFQGTLSETVAAVAVLVAFGSGLSRQVRVPLEIRSSGT